MNESEQLFKELNDDFNENLLNLVSYHSGGEKRPEFGEIVFANYYSGKSFCFSNQLARVVQVRLAVGQFGSDVYFLRKPDGQLITAENQSFRKIPDKFIPRVEALFKTDLEYEKQGLELGYKDSLGDLKVGFIIHPEGDVTCEDPPLSIAVTKHGKVV